jgi:hypothetical protein
LALTDGSDIALLVLRDPVTDVEPIAIRRGPVEDLTGREVTAVGCGQTPSGSAGVKYRTTTTVESVTPWHVWARMTICQGDSGGPLILESDGVRPREIVGVASFGQLASPEETCPAERDAWNRIDLHLDLVDLAILRSGGCVARGKDRCNSLDDDCDGTVDEGCAALGDPCARDDECAYAPLPEAQREGAPPAVLCAEIEGARRCALPCDALHPAESCAAMRVAFRSSTIPLEGFICAATGPCEGLCVPGTPGAGGNAAPCRSHRDCASLYCSTFGVCGTPRRVGAGACPSTEVCAAGSAACGVCANPASVPAGRTIGEPCDASDQCASGWCAEVDGARICTASCSNDLQCGAGFRCAETLCARGERSGRFGTCRSDADCAGARCIERNGARFCAPRCSVALSCIGTCTDVGGEMLCLPHLPVLGEACTDACAIGRCEGGFCTASCGGDRACPIGHDCVRESGRTTCRPRRAGDCAVTPGVPATRHGTPLAPWLALALLAAGGGRRRTRARRR